MCDLKIHECKVCKKEYICNVVNWLCPTVGGDENGLMCENCEYVSALEMEEYERDEYDRLQRAEDNARWEREYGDDE